MLIIHFMCRSFDALGLKYYANREYYANRNFTLQFCTFSSAFWEQKTSQVQINFYVFSYHIKKTCCPSFLFLP